MGNANAFTRQAGAAAAADQTHKGKGATTPAASRAAKAPTAQEIRQKAVPTNPGERNRK